MQAIMMGLVPPPDTTKRTPASTLLSPVADLMGTLPKAEDEPLSIQKLQLSGAIPGPSRGVASQDQAATNYFDTVSKGLTQQQGGIENLEKLVQAQNEQPDGKLYALSAFSDLFNKTNNTQALSAADEAKKQQYLKNMEAVQSAKNNFSDRENELSKAQLTYEQAREKADADREQFKLLYGLKSQIADSNADKSGFKQEQALFNDWAKNDVTKASQNVATGYEKVMSAANNPSAAGDLSLVFGYMKMLDPGSVVREGEFKTAAEARAAIARFNEKGIPLPAFLVQGVQKMESGQFLLPEQRLDFGRQAGNVYKAQLAQQKRVDATYSSRAKDSGVDPEKVVKGRTLFGDNYDEKPKDDKASDPAYQRLLELRKKRGG